MQFIELIDSKNGLLDEMLTKNDINRQQKHDVEYRPTDEQRNRLLLYYFQRGSLAFYKSFIDCLMKSKQYAIVSLLAPDMVGDVRPLSEEQLFRLQTNYATVADIIDTENGLLTELLATDCITDRQRKYVESAITELDRNGRLLDIVRRGSETNFNSFIRCLDITNQHHISCTLQTDVAVAHIVATISSEADDVDVNEGCIVDNMMALLQNKSDDRKQLTIDKLQQRLNELRNHRKPLIAAKKGNSICLYYLCTSLSGLQHLKELYFSGQLTSLLQEIFTQLLNKSGHTGNVRIDTMLWNQSNYTNCIRNLYSFKLVNY